MERALSDDLERVASSRSNEGNIVNVQLLSNDSSLGDAHIRVPAEGQITRDAIEAAYATTLTAGQMKRLVVSMAGEEIDMETDFVSNGIEDGARLEVCIIIMLCLLFSCPFFCANGTVAAVVETWLLLALLCTGLSPEEDNVGGGGGGGERSGGAQP